MKHVYLVNRMSLHISADIFVNNERIAHTSFKKAKQVFDAFLNESGATNVVFEDNLTYIDKKNTFVTYTNKNGRSERMYIEKCELNKYNNFI